MKITKTVVELEKVNFDYNGDYLLKNISINVEERDFVAIIGPNGAGKTTLIKIILGLLKPNSGKIKLFSKNIEDFHEKDWNLIGYIPQKAEIDNNFPGSVKEILSMKCINIDKKVLEILNLENLLEQKFSNLSGGQQQKVLIALALSSDPKLLILDEPTVGVDASALQKFYEILQKLNKEKQVTVIIVTHEIGIIQNFVKSVICINREFTSKGDPKDIDQMLKQAYGAGFEIHKHV